MYRLRWSFVAALIGWTTGVALGGTIEKPSAWVVLALLGVLVVIAFRSKPKLYRLEYGVRRGDFERSTLGEYYRPIARCRNDLIFAKAVANAFGARIYFANAVDTKGNKIALDVGM